MARFEDYTWVSRLLGKALEGVLTVEEEERLRAWRSADARHEALYGRVMSGEFLAAKRAEWEKADRVAAYLQVRARCRARRRLRTWRRVWGVAAAVLLVVGIGAYGLFAGMEKEEPLRVSKVEILPGSARAELILAGGERLVLGDEPVDSVWVQEGMEVRTTGEQLSYAGEGSGEALRYNVLRVPRGGEFAVELADGTLVRLNSDSELRYPVHFAGGERRVYLRGEGYFEVVKDAGKPFVVEAGGMEGEVLGTTFNVSAYADEGAVATTLVEGAVRFSGESGSVELSPGEQGLADGAGAVTKREVDVNDYVAWQKGQFVFRHRTLEEVIRVVCRWYNVEAVFESAGAKGIYFTGNMRRYGDFEQVVRMLELTGGLDFRIEGRTIYIREKKNAF